MGTHTSVLDVTTMRSRLDHIPIRDIGSGAGALLAPGTDDE